MLHSSFGNSVKEMETVPAAQIAGLFNIPFLGARVVSANITSGDAYDSKTGEACEGFVFMIVKEYVADLRRFH